MTESVRASLAFLVRSYYGRLKELGGGEGLYVAKGTEFVLPGEDYILFATFDAFSIGWDAVQDTPQGRNLRNLTTEVRTRELERAFGVFGAVATTYFEGKPVRFDVSRHSASDVTGHCPELTGIPHGYGSDDYSSFRGTVAQVRRVLVDAGVKFGHVSILEVPRPESPYFSGDDLTGRRQGPTNYTMKFGLTGSEDEIVRYANLMDKILGRVRS